jgi:enamine deaminase RidA (YjgF/YER057c/UK114 family)
MGKYRRVNVNSGRALEQLAHYSRAMRWGDRVLQTGTTAIDVEGNVIGEGDVAAQVDYIVGIARETMGRAGGRLEDVVRSRIYVTDVAVADAAGRARARHFRDVRPAATLVQVNRLARPAQLIEIEFDAIDGARERAVRIGSGRPTEERYAYSRAVRVDDQVFLSGTTALAPDGTVAHPGDMYRQTRATLDALLEAAEQAGAGLADVVYTKTFVTDMSRAADHRRAKLEVLGEVRPTGTLLGIPGLIAPEMLIEIEAEAIVGAAAVRRDLYTGARREHPLGYARAVEVGDQIFVSGCTAMSPSGEMRAAGDWAAQHDLCHEAIRDILAEAGASLDDVVRRRIFTTAGAEQNRPYGEGPAWFAASRPASLGCRIASLAHPDMLVEVDAMAVKGAHADIEWLGPED